MLQAPMNQPNRSSFDGPVAIFWDIKNCRVPRDVRPEDVAGNIIVALQGHPLIKGAVTTFSAYGDFTAFPRQLREGCQRTGVRLIDVPNGRKDAARKDILVDMILFARDNPPPSSIMLISGDVDFAPALHRLGRRGCIVILVIPSGVGVSSALSNAGKFVWDWPSVARGKANLGAAGNCETMLSERKITLKSSDGETFEVDEAVALESQIIKHMVEVDCVDNGIPLPNVTSKILAKVIEYCKKHVEAEPDDDSAATTSTPTSTDEDIKAWDADFVNVDQATLFDLILAANYLNIENLMDLACQTVADMIKHKTPEEIRQTLNVKDLTPEEEEEVRRENQWAFE